MRTIKGTSRQQLQFSSLDDLITADHAVCILDAYVEKLDMKGIGIRPHTPPATTHK